jgi:hypothetical protein
MFTTSLCHSKQETKLVGFGKISSQEKQKEMKHKKKEHEQQTVDDSSRFQM